MVLDKSLLFYVLTSLLVPFAFSQPCFIFSQPFVTYVLGAFMFFYFNQSFVILASLFPTFSQSFLLFVGILILQLLASMLLVSAFSWSFIANVLFLQLQVIQPSAFTLPFCNNCSLSSLCMHFCKIKFSLDLCVPSTCDVFHKLTFFRLPFIQHVSFIFLLFVVSVFTKTSAHCVCGHAWSRGDDAHQH